MKNESLADKWSELLGRRATGVSVELRGVDSRADVRDFYNLVKTDPYLASLFNDAKSFGVKKIVITPGGIEAYRRDDDTIYVGIDTAKEDTRGLQSFLTHEFEHRYSEHEFDDEVKTHKASLDRLQRLGVEIDDDFLEFTSFEPLMSHAKIELESDALAYYFFNVAEPHGFPGKSNYLKALAELDSFDYSWTHKELEKFVNRLKPLFGLRASIAASSDQIDTLIDNILGVDCNV